MPRLLCLSFGWMLLSFATVFAADHHPVVPAYDRFHADGADADQVAAGQLLMSELNCAGCHQDEALSRVSKQPPLLAEVGARVKPAYLRKFISDPHASKPGTTMPNALANLSGADREQAVESLVHYLVSLSDELPEPGYVPGSARSRGEALFHTVGCVACHGGRKDDSRKLPHAVPLGDPDEKYTIKSLTKFLRDPLHVRVSGRMPNFGLSARDAQALAAYLLPSVPEKPGIEYAYYEGSWQKLPDFDKLKPKVTGTTKVFDVEGLAAKDDHYGMRFEGTLEIADDGEYEFELGSDDGSRLYIDDKLVVDNDGVHGEVTVKAKTTLKKGRHSVRAEFFEQSGGVALKAWYSGPGVERRDLAEVLLSAKPTVELETIEFAVDKKLAAAGAKLFQSQGCASCHDVGEKANGSKPDSLAKSFGKALGKSSNTNRACLADKPLSKAGVPWYGFTTGQRAAVRAAVKAGSFVVGDDHGKIVHATMSRLNCVACHKREEIGGIVDEVNAYFTGTQPEMGDEGRVPPYLTGVGAKIRPEYLAGLVTKGGKDRPYMNTRMPGFGEANAKQLLTSLAKHDVLKKTLPKVEVARKDAKKAARHMIGAKGFSCIKCHTFGRFKATGVQSIDMTKMTERLQEEWFRQYVRNPIAFRPGTRMPSAWPLTGKSILKKHLDGDSEKQIQAVWTYLTDGARARVPDGLGGQTMELIPGSDAIIYRNFIQGAGARAIGVGYPEGFNLAFDANDLRLAMIWQGPFMDASRHWTGRGQGFQPPLGDKVVKLPESVAFAKLENAKAAWPEKSARDLEGYQFRGYSLTEDQRPTFKYEVAGFEIHDMPNAVDEVGLAAISRKLEVKGSGDTLYYRAAVGDIDESDEGYQVGDVTMKFDLPAGSKPIVRKTGDQKELLIPLQGGATLIQYYIW